MIVNRETRVQTRLDDQSGTRNDILLGEDKYLFFSILFLNTHYSRSLLLRCGKIEEVETVIDSRSKHEFLEKKGLGRLGRSTFLLGPDQRLSGKGVYKRYINIIIIIIIIIIINGIHHCPLGFGAPCTCIPYNIT